MTRAEMMRIIGDLARDVRRRSNQAAWEGYSEQENQIRDARLIAALQDLHEQAVAFGLQP